MSWVRIWSPQTSQFFQCGDRLYSSESDVYRRQILTYKEGPRTERVNMQPLQPLFSYVIHVLSSVIDHRLFHTSLNLKKMCVNVCDPKKYWPQRIRTADLNSESLEQGSAMMAPINTGAINPSPAAPVYTRVEAIFKPNKMPLKLIK